MINMAALIRPAKLMATTTSTISKRNKRCCCPGSVTTIRCWVRAEWRKITWGITVAPRMPVASRMLSVPANWGTTAWYRTSPQSGRSRMVSIT